MKTYTIVMTIMLFAAASLFGGDIKGKVTAKGARDNANAVVFIEKVTGKTFEALKEHAEVRG